MSNRTLTLTAGRMIAFGLAVTVFSTMAPARAQEGGRGQAASCAYQKPCTRCIN